MVNWSYSRIINESVSISWYPGKSRSTFGVRNLKKIKLLKCILRYNWNIGDNSRVDGLLWHSKLDRSLTIHCWKCGNKSSRERNQFNCSHRCCRGLQRSRKRVGRCCWWTQRRVKIDISVYSQKGVCTIEAHNALRVNMYTTSAAGIGSHPNGWLTSGDGSAWCNIDRGSAAGNSLRRQKWGNVITRNTVKGPPILVIYDNRSAREVLTVIKCLLVSRIRILTNLACNPR